MSYYNLEVLGLKRSLPILPAPSGIKIAGFNCVGDMQLLKASSNFLVQKIKEEKINYDIILTTELKGVSIAQEVARELECDYICLRKSKKCYMLNPKSIKGESITSGKSEYFISTPDLERLKGKQVLFVDDVFSTGATFDSMLDFSMDSNFSISAGLYILKEGGSLDLTFDYKNTKMICCGYLPLPRIN